MSMQRPEQISAKTHLDTRTCKDLERLFAVAANGFNLGN